jgi:hypothetical protein
VVTVNRATAELTLIIDLIPLEPSVTKIAPTPYFEATLKTVTLGGSGGSHAAGYLA